MTAVLLPIRPPFAGPTLVGKQTYSLGAGSRRRVGPGLLQRPLHIFWGSGSRPAWLCARRDSWFSSARFCPGAWSDSLAGQALLQTLPQGHSGFQPWTSSLLPERPRDGAVAPPHAGGTFAGSRWPVLPGESRRLALWLAGCRPPGAQSSA